MIDRVWAPLGFQGRYKWYVTHLWAREEIGTKLQAENVEGRHSTGVLGISGKIILICKLNS
jgi:hypothetical protein